MPNPEQPNVRSHGPRIGPGRPVRGYTLPEHGTSALGACLDTVAALDRPQPAREERCANWPRRGRLLRDVGLTREQALREAAKPFWQP